MNSIPDYKLVEPTEQAAVESLQRVFGVEGGNARWSQACQDAKLRPGAVRSAVQLEQVATALSFQGGAAATVARSIDIRIRTFNRMASFNAPTSAGASAR